VIRACLEEEAAGGDAKDAGAGAAGARTADGAELTIPVRYGGAEGPDLAEVAARLRLTEDEVVRLHAGTVYRVFCMGFVPGFPYLGTLPAELALPRRSTPRLSVPAGSVAITGRQTGIYPAATPGGWHLVGRTDATIWDPRRDPPALLEPGARVRFQPA
jgi:KipI family sensor histidine kinase inhibitor